MTDQSIDHKGSKNTKTHEETGFNKAFFLTFVSSWSE